MNRARKADQTAKMYKARLLQKNNSQINFMGIGCHSYHAGKNIFLWLIALPFSRNSLK